MKLPAVLRRRPRSALSPRWRVGPKPGQIPALSSSSCEAHVGAIPEEFLFAPILRSRVMLSAARGDRRAALADFLAIGRIFDALSLVNPVVSFRRGARGPRSSITRSARGPRRLTSPARAGRDAVASRRVLGRRACSRPAAAAAGGVSSRIGLLAFAAAEGVGRPDRDLDL
jgi:hypothetical protein